jgi:hypothetical protein
LRGFQRLLDALQPGLDQCHVAEQHLLGDGLDVAPGSEATFRRGRVVRLERAHHERQGVDFAKPLEEVGAELLLVARPERRGAVHELDRGGRLLFRVEQVHGEVVPGIGHGHRGDGRVPAGAAASRRGRLLTTGQGVEKRCLAGLRQSDDANTHEHSPRRRRWGWCRPGHYTAAPVPSPRSRRA